MEVGELAARLRFEVLFLGGLGGGSEGGGIVRRELERGMGVVGWLTFLESS